MKITDKEVLKQLKIVRCSDLDENIRTLSEDGIEGRSDMQVLKDELEYLLSMYDEGGTCYSEDLEQAREFMRETKNGKVIPCYNTLPPTPKYSVTRFNLELGRARNTINEYNRLKSLDKRLRGR